MILQRTATIPSTGVPGVRVLADVSIYIEPSVETNGTNQESEHESTVGSRSAVENRRKERKKKT